MIKLIAAIASLGFGIGFWIAAAGWAYHEPRMFSSGVCITCFFFAVRAVLYRAVSIKVDREK